MVELRNTEWKSQFWRWPMAFLINRSCSYIILRFLGLCSSSKCSQVPEVVPGSILTHISPLFHIVCVCVPVPCFRGCVTESTIHAVPLFQKYFALRDATSSSIVSLFLFKYCTSFLFHRAVHLHFLSLFQNFQSRKSSLFQKWACFVFQRFCFVSVPVGWSVCSTIFLLCSMFHKFSYWILNFAPERRV